MEISVAICDDLAEERVYLSALIRNYFQKGPHTVGLSTFGSGDELLNTFRPGRYHVIFLDIYMDGLSGMETAKQIRKRGGDCALVFATHSADHGIDSYEVQAADYLLKPFTQGDVNDALDWCVQSCADQLRCLEIRSEWECLLVPLQQIRYIEIKSHTAMIYTVQTCIPTRRGLDELTEEINSRDFLRCHRSFLVNMGVIERMVDAAFYLKDGTVVPIGSSIAPRVKQSFVEWTFAKAWESR